MALNVVVVGAGGRLGSLIVAEARNQPDLVAVPLVGRAASLASHLSGAHVVIDATTAGATAAHARACAEARVPLVVATTGMSADDDRALDDAARSIAVLAAANLSLSAHVAAGVVGEIARKLASYDVEVVEVHHKRKKDAPSGTALMLAKAAADARSGASIKRGRDGHAPRADGEIGVSAVRGGDVVGEHTVLFLGDGERIEIVHRITDRGVFARGALAAARFVAIKKAGRYTMRDVVGAV